ncbi:unnamed protein product [Prorocentrum cordatum]|uniref:Uncharacterized protein n=1 Tax=Prorocentrum cordatum TaxID=2364126 RepID=A0ABN9UJR8_9DINO|nr:unnamed protein product [Polarella glacialis]
MADLSWAAARPAGLLAPAPGRTLRMPAVHAGAPRGRPPPAPLLRSAPPRGAGARRQPWPLLGGAMLPALSAARAAVVRARPRTRRRARKRLQLDSWSACTSWGNGNIIGSRMKRNDNTDVLVAERVVHDTYRSTPYPKWVPSRDLWTDEHRPGLGGSLRRPRSGSRGGGLGSELRLQLQEGRESMRWAPGLVIAVDRERNLAAVSIAEEFAREVAEAEIGAGNLRRQEDDRFVIDPKVVSDVAAHRSRSLHEAVFRLGMELTNHADRSYVVTVLARMGQPGGITLRSSWPSPTTPHCRPSPSGSLDTRSRLPATSRREGGRCALSSSSCRGPSRPPSCCWRCRPSA